MVAQKVAGRSSPPSATAPVPARPVARQLTDRRLWSLLKRWTRSWGAKPGRRPAQPAVPASPHGQREGGRGVGGALIPAAPLIDRWPRLWLPGVARRMGRRAEPMGHPIGPLVLYQGPGSLTRL